MLNLKIKASSGNEEITDLNQQHCIHLRNTKLAISLLREVQECEMQTPINILLSLLLYKEQHPIPSFQFSFHIRSGIAMYVLNLSFHNFHRIILIYV
jgi:hypothetical protein